MQRFEQHNTAGAIPATYGLMSCSTAVLLRLGTSELPQPVWVRAAACTQTPIPTRGPGKFPTAFA